MKSGIPLPVNGLSASAPAHLHIVPPPPSRPATSQLPTLRLDDPLATEQLDDGDDDLAWSQHDDAPAGDEPLDEDEVLALCDDEWDEGAALKRTAKRLLARVRKIV